MSAATQLDDRVSRLLAAGQTVYIDAATGRHQALYATCPTDGQPAGVRRISRGSGGAIVEAVMRCSRCGAEFTAAPEALSLR